MSRYLLPLAVFILLAILLAVGLTLNPRLVPSPLIDKPAPAFDLPRLLQPQTRIGLQDMRGRPALLNVWASWCVACRQEHPLLMRLAKSRAVPIYGLNYKNKRKEALGFLNKLGNPYTAVAFDLDGRVGIDWGVYAVPETFVIDHEGIIRYKHIGPLTEKILNREIMPLLQKLNREAG